MKPELMPDWEVDLRGTFRNRMTVERYQRNVTSLHTAIENYTGETYKPKPKTLYNKILDVLKLHDIGRERDAKAIQLHLFFFYQKSFNRSHISRTLKKIAASGILEETARGLYKKVG